MSLKIQKNDHLYLSGPFVKVSIRNKPKRQKINGGNEIWVAEEKKIKGGGRTRAGMF